MSASLQQLELQVQHGKPEVKTLIIQQLQKNSQNSGINVELPSESITLRSSLQDPKSPEDLRQQL